MKTIKVFIASSEELHLERLEFTDMIMQLNKALKPRGIEIEPVKWEYLDASMNAERKQTEYNIALKECELCLVMYWTKFGEYTEEELTTAWEGLKAGKNPRKLYVYFKEPGEVSEDLKEFKNSFVSRYGHFYCKFENVDTLRLNFLLQFEQYQSLVGCSAIAEINDSRIELDGREYVSLKNIPFIGNNAEHNGLVEQINELKEDIEDLAPDSTRYAKKTERLRELENKLTDLERSLWNTALMITRLSTARCSERLQRAMDLFNDGDDKGANAILREDEIDNDVEHNLNLIRLGEEGKKGLAVNIDEYKLKISILKGQPSSNSSEQIVTLCQKVLKLCDDLYGQDSAEAADAHYLLAQAYADNDNYVESDIEFGKSLELHMSLNNDTTMHYADILRDCGRVHVMNGMFLRGKPFLEHALAIIAGNNEEGSLAYVKALRDMSSFYRRMDLFDQAVEYAQSALDILASIPGYEQRLYNSIKKELGITYSIREKLIETGPHEFTRKKDDDDTAKGMQLLAEVCESESDDKKASLSNLSLLGRIVKKNSGWPKKDNPGLIRAADFFTKALQIAIELDDKQSVTKLLEEIGEVYSLLGTPEKAEELGYSYPELKPSDCESFSEAFIRYSKDKYDNDTRIAGKIADLYLERFPRELSYGVTLTSTEDDSELTIYHKLSEDDYAILKRCCTIAAEERCSLYEILDMEGYDDLISQLVEHNTLLPLNLVESVDLVNPLQFTKFSFQPILKDGNLGSNLKIDVPLDDVEYKTILTELLYYSNKYSMNNLVYHKPELCQKITQHLSYAYLDNQSEYRSPFIADMYEIRCACEGILNPFKDVLGLFRSQDNETRDFVIGHQLVPECGEFNEIFVSYDDNGGDSFHVQMHFVGSLIKFDQEGMTSINNTFHDIDSFTVESEVVMKEFALEKPDEIYPYLQEHFQTQDCFYRLRTLFLQK